MFPLPPIPALPTTHTDASQLSLRYDDIAQDGRLRPIALPPQLAGLWRHILANHPGHRTAMKSGVVPILTRMTAVTTDQPIRIDRPVDVRAGFELARDAAAGKLFMNLWAEVHGAAGRVSATPPGPPALAGTLFAEHTFTRLFAPKGQRSVERLDVPGYPAVPDATHTAAAPTTAADLPADGAWLDELVADPTEIAFTLDQTDSNQHVNSLVYLQVFLDAIARRLAASGRSLAVGARAIDIAYRKPSFAGDRVRAHVRLFSVGDRVGGAGFIAAPGEEARPRCYVRAIVSP